MDTARLSRPTAALVGLLSVVAALGAGHLVAGLVGSGASPYLAVGNTAIDLTPSAVKDFAIRAFGTYDKLVLLGGMAVVIGLFGAAAGLASRRRSLPGAVWLGALGVIGVVAVYQRPDLGQLAPLAPMAALAAGVTVFGWLHGLAAAREPMVTTRQPVATARRPATAHKPPAHEPAAAPHETADTGLPNDGHGLTERRTRAYGTADTPGSGRPGGGGAGEWAAGRRQFLVASAGTVVAAAVAGGAGQLLGSRVDVQASRRAVGQIRPVVAAAPIPAGADFAAEGSPSFITSNAEFYRIDTALVVPRVRAEGWSLRVHGMVDRELTVSYDDLRRRELVEQTVTLTCVSNEVGGPYVSTANFVGVPLRDILDEAGVLAGADQLASRSVDGWTCGTPTEVVMEADRGALLALAMNGEPLPAEHGFPVRMVVPGLYGYVSATKWLEDIELTRFDAFDPYWARRGWAKQAPIKTMSRIDRPGGFQRVPAGRVVAAGVAWAQHRGIDAVEVRLDGGPWVETTLATEVNLDTWRMWRAELDIVPGGHTLEARATDKTGYTQTAARAEPVPDGATGWHSIFFNAT